MFTKTVPTVYQSSKTVKSSQKQSKDSQNSKDDHWCTNRHMSTKTVPTVYQSSKTVKRQSKQQKMTTDVPIVTCLHRVRRIHQAVADALFEFDDINVTAQHVMTQTAHLMAACSPFTISSSKTIVVVKFRRTDVFMRRQVSEKWDINGS